jgi:hypothetical protein
MIEEVTIEEGKYTKPPYIKGSVEEHIAYTYSGRYGRNSPRQKNNVYYSINLKMKHKMKVSII